MKNSHAIILAAGSSRRMGAPKLLLPYPERSMIEKTVRNILESEVAHIRVVLGNYSEKVKKSIEHLPVEFCQNRDPGSGMFSSVVCGFNHLPADADPILVFLGDQPEIPSKLINLLLGAYRSEKKGMVIPVYQKRRGHPLLIGRNLRRQVLDLDPGKGLRMLRHLYPEEVIEIEVDSPGILMDIDTREDYVEAIKTQEYEGRTDSFYPEWE